MKVLVSLFILFFGSLYYSSAAENAGSRESVKLLLEKLHGSSLDDTSKASILHQLSDKYAMLNKDSSFYYALQSADLARKANFERVLPEILTNLGIMYAEQQQLPAAMDNYLEALALYKKQNKLNGIARVQLNIGNTYYYREMYDKSLAHYEEAVRSYLETGDQDGASDVYMNMGVCTSLLGDNIKAIGFYKKALEIKRRRKNMKGVASCLQNIGLSYGELKRYDDAVACLDSSLKIREEMGNKTGMAIIYVSLGDIHRKMGKLQEAKRNLSLAIETAGEYYKYGTVTLEAYSNLLEISRKEGNDKMALEYSMKLIEIKDSIHARQKSQDIAEMSEKFESEKKELSIQNLNKEKELQSAEIKKQNAQKISFAAGFALMVLLSGTIFLGYRQKKKANTIILKQKEEVEFSKAMLEGQKILLEEKNRDITDSINYARRIQTAILTPPEVIANTIKDFFILFKPKDIVSGDFYYFASEGDKTVIAVADCTGHGVPGAFMSLIGNDLLSQIIIEKKIFDPGEILSKLHDGIRMALKQDNADSHSTDGMDIALCTISRNKLTYAGALRNLYLLRKDSKQVEEIKADKKSIGGVKSDVVKSFTTHEIEVEVGDTFYITSDGFADQFGGPDGKKFMTKRMKEMFVSVSGHDLKTQGRLIDDLFTKWKGDRSQTDDVCLLGVKITS